MSDSRQEITGANFINDACPGPSIGDRNNEEITMNSPWARKSILCLDGGGIRGYSSLLILKALMEKIQRLETTPNAEWGATVSSSWDYPWQDQESIPDNRFYPAHYFDYMAGTSTGGLSAIMMGRLKMTVNEALEQYTDFGNSVFGHPRWVHERSGLFYPRAKYRSKRLKRAILEVVRRGLRLEKEDNYCITNEPFASNEHQCRTMVNTFKKNARTGVDLPYLYRTFNHPIPENKSNLHLHLNPGPASGEPIWHAARATTAAQSYFKGFKVGHDTFVDGGMGANNPSWNALAEVLQMHPHSPSILVSIGTGQKTDRPPMIVKKEQLGEIKGHSRRLFIKKYLEWKDDIKGVVTDTEGIAGQTQTLADAKGTGYVRFQIPNTTKVNGECLGSTQLDQWIPPKSGANTLKKMQQIVEVYLRHEDVQRDLDDYAHRLVALRRRRAETDRWERFATNFEYKCDITAPCAASVPPKNRPTFRRHVQENHSDYLQGKDLERVLDRHRRTAERNFAVANPGPSQTGETRQDSRI